MKPAEGLDIIDGVKDFGPGRDAYTPNGSLMSNVKRGDLFQLNAANSLHEICTMLLRKNAWILRKPGST